MQKNSVIGTNEIIIFFSSVNQLENFFVLMTLQGHMTV